MSVVNDLLNRIWSEYNRAGIADDFAIILRIAELLTLDLGHRIPNVLQFVELDRRNEEVHIDRLTADLEEAAEKAGGKAQLLDRYVLFRLTERLPGVRFPTPRHIVETMQHLAQIKSEDILADLACGSGGFLVSHTENSTRPKESIGIDISPEWVALAWANTILHNETNVDIIVGNALRVYSRDGNLYRKNFDRILMAPPFGLSIDPWLAERAIGFGVGSSSEIALTVLALEMLAKGGRATLLVPTGLLFRNGAGEKWLRKELVQMCDLEAIITLPKDALQPFSSLQVHLLIVHKPYSSPSSHQNQTWFFQTEFDGYPVGRGRDLTEPPKEQNDLPFMEAVILNHTKPFNETFPKDENALIGIRRLRVQNHLLGITIQALNNTQLSHVERFSSKSEPSISFLLVEVANSDMHNTIRVLIALGGEEDVYEESRSPKELSEEYSSWQLFEGNEVGQAVAINENGRLLGVTASTSAQVAKSYDLRPDQYARVQDIRQAVVSPAIIVERIRLNQSSFLQRLDGLALRIGLMDTFLQTQVTHVQEDVRPLAGLSVRQQQIWDQILELTKGEATESFSVQKLQNLNPSLHSKELVQTLDLLEYMGAIIPITKVNQKTLLAEETDYYARITTQDQWIWNA